MASDAAQIEAKGAANGAAKVGKARLLTLADLDGRTRAAQVAEGTRSAIMADLGGEDRLSTLERIQAENAAMNAAILRDMHVRWLKGEPVDVAMMLSVENTFNRTAAALGTARRAKDVMTIDSYLNGAARTCPEQKGN